MTSRSGRSRRARTWTCDQLRSPGRRADHGGMRRPWIAAALVIGCGESENTGPCAPRSGLYKATYSERSGTCGPINDVIINADDKSVNGADACMGMAMDSSDMCDVTVEQSCPFGGNVLVSRGKVEWNPDATGGSGEMYVELRTPGGSVLCNSVYAVAFARL